MNPVIPPVTMTERSVIAPLLSPTGRSLDGGGELGSRIRALDWSLTQLGPVEAWPQSLRTSVSIVLASRSPLSIWWGPEYVLLYNDAYAPLLGAKHPAALGRPALEVWAEVKDMIGPMLDQVTTTGESTYTENGLVPVTRYGPLEESYFTWSYSPIRVESGDVGGVFMVVTETTLQVLGERRRVLLRDLAIATSGAKQVDEACRAALRAFVPSAIPFALIYLLDDDGVTARLTATFELPPGQPASPETIDLASPFAVWPLASAEAPGALHRVEDLEARFGALPSASWPAPPHEAIVLPIRRPNGARPFGFLVAGLHRGHALDESYRSFFDIIGNQLSLALTHARAFEETEARALALAELDRAKIAFFSNISHEFRTPLTLLLGPLDDALQDTVHPPSAVQRERLEIARRNAIRLLRLVNTLLDFSRLEAGRADASYEPVDLGAFTTELASNFRSAIERAGLELVVDVPAEPVTVFVDRDMWEKTVFNLLSNALKFTFDGQIRLVVRRAGDRVEVEVHDTGSGIPAAELAKIFTRFHRVQGMRARTHEGSGIGLAFVQEIVRLHGGEIAVRSAPGAGATFTVSLLTGSSHLPASQVRGASATAPTSTGAMPFVEEALRWLTNPNSESPEVEVVKPYPVRRRTRERILVADDNADMRDYLLRILGETWTVELASNGADALAAVRLDPPDLVLADVMMPVMNGFDLVRELRADASTTTIPVVLLSARAGQEAQIQGLESGAEDYLVKPFVARELIARITMHLDIGRRRAHERVVRAQLHRRLMQLPAGILALCGPTHIIELANPEYQRAVGHRATPGKPLVEALPEIVGQPFLAELDSVYRTGIAVVGEEVRAMLDQGANGVLEEYFFDYSYQPTLDAGGEVDGVLVYFVDVTNHVRARRRVELLVARAVEDDQRKDEFLAMLAHELRNPLAALSTALELLSLRAVRDDLEQRGREVCVRQITTLVRLVDDLLDVSRITRGRVDLRLEPTDLVAVVQTALQTTRSQIERHHHTVAIHVGPGAFVLDADPTRLEQVFTNLLTNAAKYTDKPGRIDVHLTRDDDATGSWARVEVADPGRGIAPEMIGGIFSLFAQVDSGLARSQGGLGIGLTLVRSLVELHGGQIQARSAGLGHGTTMIVRLPLGTGHATGLATTTTLDPAAAAPTGARRIVLVDDNEDASMMLRDLLEMLGHTVHVANDGPSGRNLILEMRPDIAFVDIGLPGFDGYQVAREVRAVAGIVTQLVALTGYGDPESIARAREAGFDAHLTKPFAVDQLKQLIAATTAG